MTVAELVAYLEQMNPKAEIWIHHNGVCYSADNVSVGEPDDFGDTVVWLE